MGFVQFSNYLRPVQFIVHVSIVNERLKILDEMVVRIKTQSEKHDARLTFDCLLSSNALFDEIEKYREIFGKIWKLHVSLSQCFGFSILVITFNAFVSAAFTLYFGVVPSNKIVNLDFFIIPSLHALHIAILFIVMVYTCEASDALVNKFDNSSMNPNNFHVFLVPRHEPSPKSNFQERFLSANQRIFLATNSAPEIFVHSSPLF